MAGKCCLYAEGGPLTGVGPDTAVSFDFSNPCCCCCNSMNCSSGGFFTGLIRMTNVRCQTVTYTDGVPTYGSEVPGSDYDGLSEEATVVSCAGLNLTCFKGLHIVSTDSDPCSFDFSFNIVCVDGLFAIDVYPYEFPDPDLYLEDGFIYSVDDPTAEYLYEDPEEKVCDVDPTYAYSRFNNVAIEHVELEGSPPPDYSGTRLLFDLIIECDPA